MKTARLVLAACAAVSTFGLVPAISAAEEADGGARSGGAKALPVVPSHGGASEALPDASAGLGGTPVVPQPPPVVVMPPADGAPIAAEAAGADTETAPEDEVVVPLDEDEGSATVESGLASAQEVESDSGSLPFTGLALVALVAAGLGLLLAGLVARTAVRSRSR